MGLYFVAREREPFSDAIERLTIFTRTDLHLFFGVLGVHCELAEPLFVYF